MRRPRWLVGAIMVLMLSACNGDPEVLPTPEAMETPSPTPTTTPSFQLEGRVVEALGSADADQASPSPEATSTASPGGIQEEGPTEEEGTAIEQASPGSLAVRLSSYSGQDTTCVFNEGDTVVIFYTRASTFESGEVIGDDAFPKNLVNVDVAVAGRVLDEETCVLVANSVSVRQQGEPSPTPTGGGQTTSRRSGATSRRATPIPTRITPTPTTESTAGTPSADETSGDETSGDETSGDETGGDETGGDETGGDETGGDETGGDETGGDETGGDETGGDETGGDETNGDGTNGGETNGDGTNGDETTGGEE